MELFKVEDKVWINVDTIAVIADVSDPVVEDLEITDEDGNVLKIEKTATEASFILTTDERQFYFAETAEDLIKRIRREWITLDR